MANFSTIYEKLIDMGFANEAIDAAIKKGLYTFDMIFNELIETDPNLRVYSESNNYNKWNKMPSQPVLKLRANPYSSLFDGYNNIEDKLLETNIYDDSSVFDAHLTVKGDNRSFRSPFNLDKESSEMAGITAEYRAGRSSSRAADRSNAVDSDNFNKSSFGVGLSKVISSTVSSSLLSTSSGEMPNHKMTRIQIMDLLDASFEPTTFTHPFLSSICTIRDLICWFHQCRCATNRGGGGVHLSSSDPSSSSSSINRLVAIPSETSLNCLIELFQQLKWHLVMPSGAQSTRIFGNDFLDKTLECLKLNPSAHLLAIISCPSQLQRQNSVKDATIATTFTSSPKSSTSLISSRIINGNDTIDNNYSMSSLSNPNSCCCCTVQIQIINNTSINKLPYKLICDPYKTTLQRIALDFSRVCEMEIGSFTLFRAQPRQMFSYPNDYLRTLIELGLSEENVVLHCRLDEIICHDNTSNHANTNTNHANTTTNHANTTTNHANTTANHANTTTNHVNTTTNHANTTTNHANTITNHANNSSGESLSVANPFIINIIDQFDYRTAGIAEPPVGAVSNHLESFPGVGKSLPGSLTSKTVAEIWADRQLDDVLPMPANASHPTSPPRKPKSLFHFSFQVIYRSLKSLSNTVCKSIRKLPNNIQQLFIKLLLEDRLLTPSLLSFFCSPGSCLTCLDLSYNLLATNELLKCVSKCSSLQELVLDNEHHVFSNEGLWHLRYLTHLRRLSLNYCSKINDWGIQVVGVLPALSVLAIKYTSVTNVGLKHIYLHLCSENQDVMVPPLRSIDLSGLTISDECLSSLSVFNQLELLNMSSTHISNPALLPRLPELRHLDVSHCHELVWEVTQAKSLSESFPKLSSLNVRGVSTANLVHLTMAISYCKYIRQLDGIFCHPQMTASLAASLSHLPLETVVLTNCQHVTDLWLPVFARFSPTLTHLVLSSCSSIKGENNSLSNNLSRLRNLSWLDLTHLENVDTDQICQLLLGNYFPKLQVAWISLNQLEESEFRSLANSVHFKVNITRSMITNPLLDIE